MSSNPYLTRTARAAMRDTRAVDDLPRRLGFAWAFGMDTLYKFKGFQGEQRSHVLDMLRNSRVYFSAPHQFNDPYDLAPVLRLAGDPNDPQFFEELQAQERAALIADGMSEAEIDAYRKSHGVTIDRLADGAQTDLRQKLLAGTRVFCLTAERCHPLQWTHYADQHRGVCLHFACAAGSVLGQARAVKYRREREPILIPLDRQSDDEITERMALTKADFWSYEQEYRVIAHDGVDSGVPLEKGFLQLGRPILTGVTLGMRMPSDDEVVILTEIQQVCPDIAVWKAREDFDRFWMQMDQVR